MWTDKSKKGLNLFKFGRKTSSAASKLNLLWNGDQMPYSIQSCFAFVYCYNIDTIHIFRKNGNKVAHEVLYSYLTRNKEVAPTFYISSVYDVCSALKAYVKDIPGGLLVKELEHDWHKLAQCNNEAKVREKLTSIILKLPLANKNMLFHLLFLASKVSEHRRNNEMSAKSISIVLLPTMFEKVIDITKVRNLFEYYDLLEFMIDNATFVMGDDAYATIESGLRDIGAHLQIIDQRVEEPDKQEEEKRVQFVSQDSGLNSSSFIDDKASQSLSSTSRADPNYEQSLMSDQNISSMEDLLDTSDATSDLGKESQRRKVYRSSTIVHDTKIVVENVIPGRERLNSGQSMSSMSSIEDVPKSGCSHHCGSGAVTLSNHKVAQEHTCIGRKPHSIRDCRPYSICGSQDITQVIRSSPCQAPSVNQYSPVYDRTFQRMESIAQPRLYKPSPTYQISSPQNIRRKKPVLKRSSCIIGPLEKLQVSPQPSSNCPIKPSWSMNYLSPHKLVPFAKAVGSFNSTQKTPIVIKTSNAKVRKKSTLFRSRYSVPVKMDAIESAQEPASPLLGRTTSTESSAPLPQPLASYLRQRSSDETFV